MTVTPEERAEMLEVALRLVDDLLSQPMTDTARHTAREIIRHAIRETSQ